MSVTFIISGRSRFILIGHSNGGLVSRYYIENKGGNVNVDKLITIDTPHYGSKLGKVSTEAMRLGFDLNDKTVPLSFELRPTSSLFTEGGDNLNAIVDDYLASKPEPYFDGNMIAYYRSHQSDKLKGDEFKGNTKYYAIGGTTSIMISAYLPSMVHTLKFKFDPSNKYSTDDFVNAIKEAIEAESKIETIRLF